jgi:hypothetical protein
MQSRTLITAVAFGVALSAGPTLPANWQHTVWGMTPEQIIQAPPVVGSDRKTDDKSYSILGGGPIIGWQTLPPMTFELTESPTAWKLVQTRVGLGQDGGRWGGFSRELQMRRRPEV